MQIMTVVAAMLFLQGQEPKQEPPKPQGLVVESGDWKIKFYGFARLDLQFDDSKPNDPQLPQWIRSEDGTVSANTAAKGDAQFNMHPKLTRFGFDLTGPAIEALGGAKTSGKLEIDFYGGTTSESRSAPRMRHAWLKLAWTDSALTIGQRDDLIAPLIPIVNNDMVMWNAGNLADRRPQVRFEYLPKMGDGQVFLQAMIGLTGAVDNQNIGTDAGPSVVSTLDGVDAAMPTFQVRAAYKGPHLWMDGKTFEVGVWAHMATEELPEKAPSINGEDSWDSQAFGLDLTLPLYEGLDLMAELWSGKNLDDVRGGIGQGINSTGGDPDQGKEIESTGGWVQLGYQVMPSWKVYLGYSYDNPEDGLPAAAGFRDKNTVIYLGNRLTFGSVTLGIDYLNWTTEWTGAGANDGKDNRFNLFAQYNF
jgi:hypothetical protein